MYRILIFFLFSFSVSAQFNTLKYYNFNVKVHKGFVLKHNNEVAHLATQHPWLVEADMSKETNGSKYWHKYHKYPTVGYSLNFVKTDPSKPIGNMASFLFFMSKNIFSTCNSKLQLRFGIGPGYVQKIFDLTYNYKNILFGSHLNFCMNGRLNYSIDIGKGFNLNTGIGIIHFSNGGIVLPDQGVNIPSFHIGMGYQFLKENKIENDSLPYFQKKFIYSMLYAGGIKEEYPTQGPKFWASTISTYLTYKLTRKSGLSGGIDFFYDPSLKRYYKVSELPFKRAFKVGITAGHELYFGKLSFLTQIGFYIYDKNRIFLPVYERIGLKYYINNSIFIHLNMKLHLGAIDYVESGVGFCF